MKSFRAILLLSTALFAIPALAQEPAAAPQVSNPLAQRENALAPVLSWMQATGIKLIYLGGEGGIRGYLSEGANGNMQTAYLTPDGEHIIRRPPLPTTFRPFSSGCSAPASSSPTSVTKAACAAT
jgi:hypothetical protein